MSKIDKLIEYFDLKLKDAKRFRDRKAIESVEEEYNLFYGFSRGEVFSSGKPIITGISYEYYSEILIGIARWKK